VSRLLPPAATCLMLCPHKVCTRWGEQASMVCPRPSLPPCPLPQLNSSPPLVTSTACCLPTDAYAQMINKPGPQCKAFAKLHIWGTKVSPWSMAVEQNIRGTGLKWEPVTCVHGVIMQCTRSRRLYTRHVPTYKRLSGIRLHGGLPHLPKLEVVHSEVRNGACKMRSILRRHQGGRSR